MRLIMWEMDENADCSSSFQFSGKLTPGWGHATQNHARLPGPGVLSWSCAKPKMRQISRCHHCPETLLNSLLLSYEWKVNDISVIMLQNSTYCDSLWMIQVCQSLQFGHERRGCCTTFKGVNAVVLQQPKCEGSLGVLDTCRIKLHPQKLFPSLRCSETPTPCHCVCMDSIHIHHGKLPTILPFICWTRGSSVA